MGYIALRNHTPYSLLQGSIPIASLIDQAILYGMPALAIADTSHLFGALEFSLACEKKGLHPLIGCQLSWMPQPDKLQGYPLVLYAQNKEGYRNLCGLVTSSTVGQPESLRGHVTSDQLKRYNHSLIALTGGPKGAIDQCLEKGHLLQAKESLFFLKELYKDRLYIEIARYEKACREGIVGVSQQRFSVETQLIEWAYEQSLPLIATNQTYFLRHEDYEAHDTLRCIALGRYVEDEDRPRESRYHFFRSPEEMSLLFHDLPEALSHTFHLMKRCLLLLQSQAPVLPRFSCKRSEEEELRIQSKKGLTLRLQKSVFPSVANEEKASLEKEYDDRLTYECDMIIRMGFAGYFLIVSDFIQWAKDQSIPVGPGRGSGASSLVAWALSITDIDPLRFQLFFERFLNPERISMPDFDVDFCQDRRDEVIGYVQKKYGADRVAHIITFGTLQARAVLRDVGRVLQMPYNQVDKICKLIPQKPGHVITLQQALNLEPQLSSLIENDDQVEKLIRISLKLEGLYRHTSTHAAGIIISRDPLSSLLPLYHDQVSALPATEYSMKYVESAGLVKFDFLGLKTLTVVQTALDLLSKQGINLDLSCLPLDDKKTFALLRRAETVGLFQLESGGMTDVLFQLQPESFEEIIALVALYRPGPMDDIPRYIACRHGREKVFYPYPCLEEILKETFGVMVYQEQVLQIARTLAGYSLGGADLLRRSMGKKIKSEMDAQRKIFIEGILHHTGGDREKASHFFDQVAKFAGYGFPKAHSVPYALIAYHTAYLKANYPVAFMTALMIHDQDHPDKLRGFVREVKRIGLIIMPPDINASDVLFSVENEKTIRYGLSAIKNVGKSSMEKIVQERQEGGNFKDIFNFIQRTSSLGINKKNLESLIAAGAFDSLHHGKRSQMMASVESLLREASQKKILMPSLFQSVSKLFALKETAPWSPYESLHYEREALGFFLTAHPLDSYSQGPSPFILYEELKPHVFDKGGRILMMGIIMSMTEKVGKSGKKYGFLQLSDPTDSYEVTLFSDLLSHKRSLLTIGKAVSVTVYGRFHNDQLRLVVQDITDLEEKAYEEIIDLVISSVETIQDLASRLSSLTEGPTRLRLTLIIKEPPVRLLLSLPKRYHLTPSIRSLLFSLSKQKKEDTLP